MTEDSQRVKWDFLESTGIGSAAFVVVNLRKQWDNFYLEENKFRKHFMIPCHYTKYKTWKLKFVRESCGQAFDQYEDHAPAQVSLGSGFKDQNNNRCGESTVLGLASLWFQNNHKNHWQTRPINSYWGQNVELDHECKSDLDTKQKCLSFNPAWTILLLLYCFYKVHPQTSLWASSIIQNWPLLVFPKRGKLSTGSAFCWNTIENW